MTGSLQEIVGLANSMKVSHMQVKVGLQYMIFNV